MTKCSRRNIFKLAGAGSLALLLPAVAMKNSGTAWAQDNALDPESPQAKALGYVAHYDDVDQAVWTRYQEGQICGNCQLAQGDVSADWMGCGIFPGKQVAREGWCNAWVARQG
ncbi:MAG TPA: high-potential iron-sulfur protein [Wenzhouxiangella sp.]